MITTGHPEVLRLDPDDMITLVLNLKRDGTLQVIRMHNRDVTENLHSTLAIGMLQRALTIECSGEEVVK